MDVEQAGMNARVKFGDSKSNHSRDIRLPHFVTNDDDNDDIDNDDADGPYGNRAKRRSVFCLKTNLLPQTSPFALATPQTTEQTPPLGPVIGGRKCSNCLDSIDGPNSPNMLMHR